MIKEFSIGVKLADNVFYARSGLRHTFLVIPLRLHDEDGSQIYGREHCSSVHIGRREEAWFSPRYTRIEQDLSITMEKKLRLNKVIQELQLDVEDGEIFRHCQRDEIDTCKGMGESWPSVQSPEHGKLWTPRVIMYNDLVLEKEIWNREEDEDALT